MAHKVQVNAGVTSLVLTDGNVYDGVTEVTLTDDQYARLNPALFTKDILDDLGALADPDVDAVFATDLALASHAADASIHSSGRELGYAESTQTYTHPPATSQNYAVVTGLVVPVTVGVRPIRVEVELVLQNLDAAARQVWVAVFMDGVIQRGGWQQSLVNQFALLNFRRSKRLTPAAGAHTIDVRVKTQATGQAITCLPSDDVMSVSVVER